MEMTQEWITNYNKKCAEFLEWEYFQPYWYPKEDSHGIYKTPWNIEIMKFHSDWNWIMEVVEKIRKEGWRFDTSHSGSVSSKEINVFIWRKYPGGGETDLIQISNEDSKIVTIQAINQFIDWYNKQKEGFKGIKKVISESITMFKWKLKNLRYEHTSKL